MSMDASDEKIGPAGVKLIAEALRTSVTGSLTSINLSGSNLTNVGSDMTGVTELAAALGVNGSLTSIDLSGNQLCGLWTDYDGQQGTYTAEGITAIADALRVNGALIECDLRQNNMGEEEEASIRKSVQGKAGFVLHV